jgi:4-alpha-glucanotransferase
MPERDRFHHGRHAGLLVPLFSIPSTGSWGVGEIADLPRFARWLEHAGLDFVQLLPVSEMEEGQNSPYSALSAMAIDPVFISLEQVREFADGGGSALLSPGDRAQLEEVRAAKAVDFGAVRGLKSRALRAAFAIFLERREDAGAARAQELEAFAGREGWWLDEYALFRALHDEHGGVYWREWEPPLRDRDPEALAAARERLWEHTLYYRYLQWLADDQWTRARQECGRVGIFGDFPFMVGGHSADVWARQGEFDVDASVGVPPDPFSEEGQDWGLPPYRWDAMARNDYEWLRQRARRSVELYDGYRIDHLVGFYRTYARDRSGHGTFSPPDEPSQLAQGERMMRLFSDSGARIIAEDLGVVPDFVRESLARLRVPGLKVLRWERNWNDPGQPFRWPPDYPVDSVAISATHATETQAEWWDGAGAEERRLCAGLPGLAEAGAGPETPFSPAIRDALLRAIFGAGSSFVILPVQDVFGWRDRVNVPGVVADDNWTWRLPWPVDALPAQPEAQERAAFLRQLAQETGRASS